MRRLVLASAVAGLLAGAVALPAWAEGPQTGHSAGRPDPMQQSLRKFAGEWMEKLRRAESANRRKPQRDAFGLSYTGYGRSFTTELKRTGRTEVPFVGLIRYQEHVVRCADPALQRCQVVATVPVTEIFRFQRGRWIY